MMGTIAYGVLVIVVAAVAYVFVASRRHSRWKRQCADAFASVYAERSPSPTYDFSYSYGYPLFTITFPSKEELQLAAKDGLNASFAERIGELCKGVGPENRPFEVERGVSFTYEGHGYDLLTQIKTLNWHGPE